MKKKTVKAWGILYRSNLRTLNGATIPLIYLNEQTAKDINVNIRGKLTPVTITYEA